MSTISLRTDPEIEAAITELTVDGRDRSTVLREAILAARQHLRSAALRAEAAALADDPAEQAEIRAVRAELDELRSPDAW